MGALSEEAFAGQLRETILRLTLPHLLPFAVFSKVVRRHLGGLELSEPRECEGW